MTCVVFLGPTLRAEEAGATVPGAVVLPPAGQGDVFRAVRAHRPARIGLIDGAFLDVASVWHRELLWAMAEGVEVFGAASMGALRAAELHGLGMVGVGRVFEAYRDGALDGWEGAFEDDDEVAVVHGPAELGYPAVSTAMVDVRVSLDRAAAAGVIDAAERLHLAGVMKALHFPERSLAQLGSTGFAAWAAADAYSQKAEDARSLLRRLREATPSAPAPRTARMERVMTWERFVAAEDASEAQATMKRLRNNIEDWHSVAREAVGRAAASAGRGPVDEAARRLALGRLREERGLLKRADLDAWMADNDLDPASLAALLDRQAWLDQEAERPGTDLSTEMLDVLRLTGRYSQGRPRRTPS